MDDGRIIVDLDAVMMRALHRKYMEMLDAWYGPLPAHTHPLPPGSDDGDSDLTGDDDDDDSLTSSIPARQPQQQWKTRARTCA